MRRMACGVLSLAVACALGALEAIAQGDRAAPQLIVTGAVGQKLTLSASELADMPHQSLQVVNGHTGQTETYAGVPLTEILSRAGIPHGHDLRGNALAIVVIAEGADGYRVAFAMAELDAGIGNAQALVADQLNGTSLDAKQGPLRLVVPRDKRPARSVRNLKFLRIYPPPG